MITREEVIGLFYSFVREHNLPASALLVVMDCCFRELAGRGVMSREHVTTARRLLNEMDGKTEE